MLLLSLRQRAPKLNWEFLNAYYGFYYHDIQFTPTIYPHHSTPSMADSSDKPKKNKESLDLISDTDKKLSRRERQREEASKVKTVDDQKKEALDIFEEEGGEKKTSVVRKKGGDKMKLPAISKLVENENDDFTASEASSTTEADEDSGGEEAASEGGEKSGNVISIKPPIIVSDLADLMDLKSFQLMADLIKLEVFVAPHQAIEPEIAEKLCEMHGFTFKREKSEKGAGVHKEKKKIKKRCTAKKT